MFLLFFLMVAAGMLSLLWLYFPVQGGPQTEYPLPPRQQVDTPGAAAPEPAAPTASTTSLPTGPADAGTPAVAAAAGERDVSHGVAMPASGAQPSDGVPAVPVPAAALPTIEELDRQLDRLLGLPPAPPARP
jgi:hypothetical protein